MFSPIKDKKSSFGSLTQLFGKKKSTPRDGKETKEKDLSKDSARDTKVLPAPLLETSPPRFLSPSRRRSIDRRLRRRARRPH